MRRRNRLVILTLMVVLAAAAAGAVPRWVDEAAPDSVPRSFDDDCWDTSAAECLEDDDGDVVSAGHHPSFDPSPIVAERADPVPDGAVLQSISVRAKASIESQEDMDASLRVWNGGGYETVASLTSESETWTNATVTGTISPREGEYVAAVNVTSYSGFQQAEVDVLHFRFEYTRVGEVSVETPTLSVDRISVGEEARATTTVTCTGGYCGGVDATVRANGTAAGDVTGLDITDGGNPQTAVLCGGSPDAGSCSIASVLPAWNLTGRDPDRYDIDVATASNYSAEGVNEPVSSDTALHVEGGSLAASIETSMGAVFEDDTFTLTGTATCEYDGGCSGVELEARTADGDALAAATAPFATEDSNPRTCGVLQDGDSCTESWTVNATGPAGDHSIAVHATSTDPAVTADNGSAPVTIEDPSVAVTAVSQGGESAAVTAGVRYTANVAANLTCRVGGRQASKRVPPADDRSASLSLDAPDLSATSTLDCTLANASYGVEDRREKEFSVTGRIRSADTDKDTLLRGDDVTVYCALANTGNITYSGGDDATGYSQLDIALNGPGGETLENRLTDPRMEIGAGKSSTVSTTFTVPTGGTAGEWTASCLEYGLIETPTLDSGPVRKTFEVSENVSEGIGVDILSPDPQETYYVGQRVDVVAAVDHPNGSAVTGATVTANGNALNDAGKGPDQEAGDGVYSGRARIPEVDGSHRITVSAEKNDRSDSSSTLLSVQPGFRIRNVAVNDSYNVGDTIVVNGSLDARRALAGATVTAELVDPTGAVAATRTDETLDGTRFRMSHTFASGSTTGGWTVRIRASDRYENRSITRSFNLRQPNPGAFYLDFLLPDRDTFTRGDTVRVRVRPADSSTGNTVTLESLSCTLGDRAFDLSRNGTFYGGSVRVPQGIAPGAYALRCEGVRSYAGGTTTGADSVSLDVRSATLSVSLVEPRSGIVRPGANVTVRANVTRGGRPVDNASVRVYIDGSVTSLRLRSRGNGTYTASVQVPDGDALSVRAEDAVGNTGESSPVEIRPAPEGFNTRLFAAYAVILLVSVLAAYGIYRRYFWEAPETMDPRERKRMHLQEELEDLERKLNSVQGSIEDTERDYFKRKIDKETFTRMMEKYEKEKTEIINELEQIEQELNRMEQEDRQQSRQQRQGRKQRGQGQRQGQQGGDRRGQR